jgi:hypothetical protein
MPVNAKFTPVTDEVETLTVMFGPTFVVTITPVLTVRVPPVFVVA